MQDNLINKVPATLPPVPACMHKIYYQIEQKSCALVPCMFIYLPACLDFGVAIVDHKSSNMEVCHGRLSCGLDASQPELDVRR